MVERYIHKKPWQKIGTNLFRATGKSHLVHDSSKQDRTIEMGLCPITSTWIPSLECDEIIDERTYASKMTFERESQHAISFTSRIKSFFRDLRIMEDGDFAQKYFPWFVN